MLGLISQNRVFGEMKSTNKLINYSLPVSIEQL